MLNKIFCGLNKLKNLTPVKKLRDFGTKLKRKKMQTDFSEERKLVAGLITSVLSGKMIAREALLKFPPECPDLSIKTAWHALCHYESDEDQRKSDEFYAAVQDEYLENIAAEFFKGNGIPANISAEYFKYHEKPLNPNSEDFFGFLAAFESFVNIFEKKR